MAHTNRRHRLISLILVVLALYPFPSRAAELCGLPPTTDTECLNCHQPFVDQELTKTIIHRPFRENKCMLCHFGGELTARSATAFKSDRQITWLSESAAQSIEHWIPLPKDQVNGDIHLDIMVPGRGVYRGVIDSLDTGELPEMTQDGTPPELSDVKVAGVEKGLLVSATISWLTDELADSRIAYGTDKLNTIAYVGEMSRLHQITIAPLEEATEYQYQVSSADYLGNLAKAGIATFSTMTPDKPASQDLTVRSNVEPTWDRQIFKDSRAGVIILRITTTLPSKVAVGILNNRDQQENAVLVSNGKRKPCRHQLKNALKTSITACQPCHEAYFRGATLHPLQVRAKAGMVFPPELFVLANGGINCITCHSAHSSNYPNRLVKSDKEKLCRGCHNDK